MLTLKNNGPARFVSEILCTSGEYPEYAYARGMVQIGDNHIYIIAECLDGKTRSYKSTSITSIDRYDVDNDGVDEVVFITTRTGKEWRFR